MAAVTLETYTEADIAEWFATRDITKARPYVDLVRDLEIANGQIRATIPGSAKLPYVAQAYLSQSQSGEMMVVSRCTCPVGRHCKHVAAMLLKGIPEHNPKERVSSSVLSWVEDLRRVSVAVAKKKARPAGARQQLFYILKWTADRRHFGVEIRKGKYPESADEWWKVDRALITPPQFVGEEDLGILRLIWAERSHETGLRAFGLGPKHGAEILQRMAASHRLYPEDDLGLPLAAGATRPASIGWQIDAQGFQRPYLKPEPSATMIIGVAPPWYLDLNEGETGPLDVAGNPAVINRLFSLPPLSAKEAALVAEALSELAPDLPLPAEDASARLRLVDTPLQAILQLETLHTHGQRAWRNYSPSFTGGPFDVARVIFRYADVDIRPEEKSEFITLPEGETIRLKRRPEAETRALEALLASGMQKVPGHTLHTFGSPPEGLYGLAEEAAWTPFMQDGAEQLKLAGWQVEFPEDFRHHVIEVDGWEAELHEADNGWFDLDMGIIVEGERLPLAPLLAGLFRRDARWLEAGELARVPDDEGIELHTPSGKRLRVPAGRIKPLAATLIDLFDGFTGGETLRLSRFDAPRLVELNDISRWQFRGQGDVLALAERLQAAQGIVDIEPPAGLRLALRPYQKEGLAWLQFLRAQNLSGILADDMGLGKTAQTLAHLLLEQEGGRLDRPALIVLPTSLIFNWKNEAERFAPGLKVLSLHGPERKSRFAEIDTHDVVLTTYPLLWRDAEELMQHRYHLLILDEAQTVKNAQSRSAEAVRKIDTRHRLCLTGTPLENHLGELWSQFDFLLPGFLGTAKQFTRHWRTPIEKLPPHPPLHPAPEEGRRRPGTAAEDHHRPQCRTRRQPARPLRNGTGGDGRQGARRNRPARLRAQPDRHPRRPVEAASGLLRPAPGQGAGGQEGQGTGQARPVDGDAAGTGRRRPQDPRLLAIHQHAGADPAGTRRSRHRLRDADRRHGQPRNADPPLPGRRGADLPDQPEGRRRRPQPDRRRHRDPLRPVVEPGGREPGHRPRPPPRPGQAGVRLQADRARQHRGKDPRPAGTQGRAGRRHPLGGPRYRSQVRQ